MTEAIKNSGIIPKKGKWIVFEGMDGCGKTTAIHEFEKFFKEHGEQNIVILRGVGTGNFGEPIRTILMSGQCNKLAHASAFATALADCFHHIKTYLDKGYIVLSDRFIASFYAYNYQTNHDIGAEVLFTQFLTNPTVFDREPDLELVMYSDVEEAKARMAARSEEQTVIDKKPIEYFERIKCAYKQYAYAFDNQTHPIVLLHNHGTLDEFKYDLKDMFDTHVTD